MRSKIKTFLLAFFFGNLGVHRFYAGKCWSGIVWILTGGIFGVGTLVDMTMIASNKFTDSDGTLLAEDCHGAVCWILTIMAFLFYLAFYLLVFLLIAALTGATAATAASLFQSFV